MAFEQKHNFRVQESLVDSGRLVFVFTAMGTKLSLYKLFIRSLNKRGFSVVAYDYPASLVTDARFPSFNELYDAIRIDAEERTQKLNPRHMYAFGISMGTLLANRLTRDTDAIHHVILALTYGDVAHNIMVSSATRKTRKTMLVKGLNKQDLTKAVELFDPVKNARGLKNKKVWLHLGRKDKILDYKITVKTKEAFQDNISNLIYTEHRNLGHYSSGAKILLSVKKIVEFYDS